MMILKTFRRRQAPTETNTRWIGGPQYVYSCKAFVPKSIKEYYTNRKRTRNQVISEKQEKTSHAVLRGTRVIVSELSVVLVKEFDMKWLLSYLATGMWNNFYFKKNLFHESSFATGSFCNLLGRWRPGSSKLPESTCRKSELKKYMK